MRKTTTFGHITTFSLADFPSPHRARLEERIIERALALWLKKRQWRQRLKNRQSGNSALPI